MEQKKFSLFGAEVFLDRLTPPEDGIFDYDFRNCEYDGLRPYACTFTVPDISDSIFKKAVISYEGGRIVSLENFRRPDEQVMILRGMIHTWMDKFQRNLKKLAPKSSTIWGYLITYELTKRGLVHAHGLLYVDNHYHTMVSQVMTQTWLNIAGGSWKAMQKISIRGDRFKDQAFDKCNNVQSWLLYILKMKPHIIIQLMGDVNVYVVRHYFDMIKGISPEVYLEKTLVL